MAYCSDDQPKLNFSHHLNSIPHLVREERDADRYLRAFASMIDGMEEDDIDSVLEVAKDAIRFIADDAFRRGFEVCHENVAEPLRESTVSHSVALDAMRQYGLRVQQTISAAFEDEPGVPNQLTVDIGEVELPEPKLEAFL